MDRSICLEILEEYGTGSRALRLLCRILVEAPYGGTGGRVLHITLLNGERRYVGGTAVAHHLQYGVVRSGTPLVIPDGGRGWGL